jgi:hypothetical protein
MVQVPPSFFSRAERFFRPCPPLWAPSSMPLPLSAMSISRPCATTSSRNSNSVASAWRTMLFRASFTAINRS